MGEYTKVEVTDGVGRITLNRPESYNALNIETARELSEVLIEFTSDRNVECLLLTGAGKAFSAGGDIKRAMEIAALDVPIKASKALEWGIVTEVVPDNDLMKRSLAFLSKVREKSLHTFGWSKELINGSLETSLETQLARERDGLVDCVSHPEGIEGMRAFLERREPKFKE